METIPSGQPDQTSIDPASSAHIISTSQVYCTFRNNVGVFDLTLRVPTGSIFGLIGPSGSGKTTTIRLLTGLQHPDTTESYMRVLNKNPRKFDPAVRERIGYMPQQFVLYPNLTVLENVRFVASIYGMRYGTRRTRLQEVLEFVELYEFRHILAAQLSGGMQRRLTLACALIHQPTLLFADEPTAGVDPILRGKFWGHFRRLRDNGTTLFITTQYVSEAAYCDLVGVMRLGRLLYVDTPLRLRHLAMDGEIIKIVVPYEQTGQVAQHLLHPIIRMVRLSEEEPGVVYAHVDDAGDALPVVTQMLRAQSEIEVKQIEEYYPSFDDVFIALIRRYEKEHG